MHTSYEGGKLEDPTYAPEEEMFRRTASIKNTPNEEVKISIEFQSGNPISVEDGVVKKSPARLNFSSILTKLVEHMEWEEWI